MEIIEKSEKAAQAMAYFKEGYNCAQAVFLAFSNECRIEPEMALRLSSSFGGGMGRLREVCGAVSAMFLAAGACYGYTDPKNPQEKKEHYARIQELADAFKSYTGSIVCRELLHLDVKREDPAPSPRTAQYYEKRPCVEQVGLAAAIFEEYLAKHPISADNGEI